MKSKYLLLLLLILIIASFFRLYHITTTPPGLYPDEAIGGNQGLEALRTGNFKLFYPENNGRAGLFINLQGLSAGMSGAAEPWTLRFPSAILGILTVLGLYFLTKELFDQATSNKKQETRRVALLASFFLATSFWHINFSRIGFDGIMAPFFLVWSVYFLLKALRSKSAICHMPYAICAGLIYGLGFHSYIAYRVTPVLILFIIAYYLKTRWNDPVLRKKILTSIFYFLVSSFLAALPMGIYFLTHPADFSNRTPQISVFGSAHPLTNLASNIVKTLAMFNFRGDGNWRHNYPGRPELFWPVGILFLIGIIIAIKNIFKNLKVKILDSRFSILILWFALGAAPAVFSNDGIPHSLRSILMIPPTFILAATGGIAAYDFLKKRTVSFWLPVAAAIFLSLLMLEAYNTYFILWAKNPNTSGAFNADYVAFGQALNQLPPDIPKYVIVEAGGVPVNGIPMPAQTVMFITDTFAPENRRAKNIYYILPNQESDLPSTSLKFYLK